ncbi:MAG: hypothetical protein AB7T49_11330 [Oligoflexales bacterium]
MKGYHLFCVVMILMGCKHTTDSKAKDDQTSGGLAPLPCDNGADATSFTLAATFPPPNASAIDFGNQINYTLVEQVPNGPSVRIDVCIDDVNSTVAVNRMLYRRDSFSQTQDIRVDNSATEIRRDGNIYFIPASNVKAVNLDQAIFGEVDNLDVYISYLADKDQGVWIKSWKDNDLVFVTAVSAGVQNGARKPFASRLIAGSFRQGNPFTEGPCKDGQMPYDRTFKFEKAKLKFQTCTYMGGGETTGYDIKKIEITDESTHLPVENHKTYTFEGDQIKNISQGDQPGTEMRYAWSHHNACDSFVLTLPHATYTATAAAMAGCGHIIDGAPQRTWEDEQHDVMYKISYGKGEVVEGRVACYHYLLNCNQ